MKQYHDHLRTILEKGTRKEPAREGMPGSTSLFGYQNRYNLSEGFPILTTKKISFKNIVVELLWFLKGDSNIKYLVDNGCNIWNEDAFNYYNKICNNQGILRRLMFDQFCENIKNNKLKSSGFIKDWEQPKNYTLGDTGKQYPWLWRSWEGDTWIEGNTDGTDGVYLQSEYIDQIKSLIDGLKQSPMGRRHIITAWNPATLHDMALNACHAFVQFNCREIPLHKRISMYEKFGNSIDQHDLEDDILETLKENNIPKHYLDCQLYQRSADMFLGVPYNIASYALLTEIIAQSCNMVAGDFIHTFGDSHIYDNHLDQVNEILERDTEKYKLPKLEINWNKDFISNIGNEIRWLKYIRIDDFNLIDYQSYPSIKAKLSTGLR